MAKKNNKAICLYFQVHQPFRLKRYRFFDLGKDHYYYDDFLNESIMTRIADQCYLPANKILLDLIKKHDGKFRVAFSITGIAIDQLRLYAPEVLDSFRELAETGAVEFLAETDSHSLASMRSQEEFENQVEIHQEKLKSALGVEPTSFRNTELIYSDQIGQWISDMGFKAVLTEGAKHILGWKSPNFLYCNAINPRLKVLLRNFTLSDDIAFRFSNREWSEWPLTASKYVSWINNPNSEGDLLNIFLDYETFGEHNKASTGILDFLSHLPGEILKKKNLSFMTPSEIAEKFQVISAIQVPSPISWADEERDLTAWLGNDLQNSAFEKLYELAPLVNSSNDPDIKKDWDYLQASDHFYYMSTKFFSDGVVHAYFNPYSTPYDAFMNYMNVLSDFEIRLKRSSTGEDLKRRMLKMEVTVKEMETLLKSKDKELDLLRKKLLSGNGKEALSAPEPKVKKIEKVPTGKKIVKKKSTKKITSIKKKK